jgi:hypothetical protein
MEVFRRVIGKPLNAMIIQITGKGKDKVEWLGLAGFEKPLDFSTCL